MLASEFINEDIPFDSVESLSTNGATSLAYKVYIENRLYFMKQLRPEYQSVLRYRTIFHKEYELGCKISSPYVVKYESIGENENGLYILMEYINGASVEEKLKSEPEYFRSERNVNKFLLQLLEGLEAFHSKNIAYLDLNPQNVMLTQVGCDVKIVDLGFCMDAGYGYTAGSTAGFAAPELLGGQLSEVNERTDIYAVGCLLRYIEEKSGAKFSRDLQSIVQRCLNPDKSKRFPSAADVAKAVKRPKNRLLMFAGALVVLLAGLLFFINGESNTVVDRLLLQGVEYRILSREDSTCEVIGGEGDLGNIYILPSVVIDRQSYRTVSIKDSAFCNQKIKSIYLPEGLETVGYATFDECDSVVTISIPSTVKDFTSSFTDMKSLKKVKIPAVRQVSPRAFVGCEAIVDVYIPEGVERLCLDAFALCRALVNVRLPESLKVIERGVFFECKSIEEIIIPAAVTEIGDYAFYNCTALRNLYCYAPVPPVITAIFNSTDVTVHVPAESLNAYQEDFNWKSYNIVGDL